MRRQRGRGLREDADTAGVARLLVDPTRTAMLWALSDGRTLRAGELARIAGVRAATASEHLARLESAALIVAQKTGRHRYFRVAKPEVVRVLEMLATLAHAHMPSQPPSATLTGVRFARTCYDHLAGNVGVRITHALVAAGHLIENESGYDVARSGDEWFGAIGIDVHDVRRSARSSRRAFARACLDWSERRHHVAGALGASLCARLLELEWFERLPATRALRVTNHGRRELKRRLGVEVY